MEISATYELTWFAKNVYYTITAVTLDNSLSWNAVWNATTPAVMHPYQPLLQVLKRVHSRTWHKMSCKWCTVQSLLSLTSCWKVRWSAGNECTGTVTGRGLDIARFVADFELASRLNSTLAELSAGTVPLSRYKQQQPFFIVEKLCSSWSTYITYLHTLLA